MQIDLCIINHNTRDKLERLFVGLTADYIPDLWKLYVADNGSTDDSAEFLLNVEYPVITHKDFNNNCGYATASNKLAAVGNSEIIGILNADVWMLSDDVKAIAKIFEENPEIAVLGPKQRDERCRITHAGIFGTHERPIHRGFHEDDRADLFYRDRTEAITVSGSALFTRRSVWNELTNCPIYKHYNPEAGGAFLPTPMYYEETWYNYHAWAHGYKVFYDGSVSIGHTWHASTELGSKSSDGYKDISRAVFRAMCGFHDIPCD